MSISDLTHQIVVVLILEHATIFTVNLKKDAVNEALLIAYSKFSVSELLHTIKAHFIHPPSLYTEAQYLAFILENRLGMCLHLLL